MLAFDDMAEAVKHLKKSRAKRGPSCILTRNAAEQFLVHYHAKLEEVFVQLAHEIQDCGCDPDEHPELHFTTVEDGDLEIPKGSTPDETRGAVEDFCKTWELWQLWKR